MQISWFLKQVVHTVITMIYKVKHDAYKYLLRVLTKELDNAFNDAHLKFICTVTLRSDLLETSVFLIIFNII